MFDPRSFDADIETIAHLAFKLRGELLPEKRRDVIRLDRMNRGACQIPVDGLQIGLPAENNVGGVFALVHAPVVAGGEITIDRTAQARQFVQPFVDSFRFPAVGDGVCLFPVPDVCEGVVGDSVLDPGLTQAARQPVVP